MEIVLRIPTAEPYSYVEIHYESDEMTAEQVRKAYDEYTRAFKVEEGLNQKDWNDVLDRYRQESRMDESMHAKMNERQRWLVHEIDKSNTRLAYKASKLNN